MVFADVWCGMLCCTCVEWYVVWCVVVCVCVGECTAWCVVHTCEYSVECVNQHSLWRPEFSIRSLPLVLPSRYLRTGPLMVEVALIWLGWHPSELLGFTHFCPVMLLLQVCPAMSVFVLFCFPV